MHTAQTVSAADITDNLRGGKGGFALARRRVVPYQVGRCPIPGRRTKA
jgi:hypothetical protein